MKEKIYLFNEKYAENNGWTRDTPLDRRLASIKLIGILGLFIAVVLFSIFIPFIGMIISGVMGIGILPFLTFIVIKHLRKNDKSLNAEYTAFIEKEGSLYYVRFAAPDWRMRRADYMNDLKENNFSALLNESFEHPEKFEAALGIQEFDAKAEIIRLDEVTILPSKEGLLRLKYKNRNRKWRYIEVAFGYEELIEDIENKVFVQNSDELQPFPFKKPSIPKRFLIIGGILGIYLLYQIVPGIVFEKEADQKLKQVESVEELITEEMVLEVLNSKEELSFIYEETRVDINDDGGYSVYVIGYDENTGKSVMINFNEKDTGTGFAMECTDEWNAYLWISKE